MRENYISVAENDYDYFKHVLIKHLDYPNYNNLVCIAHQIAEKALKGVIEEKCTREDYTDALRSHKLVTLARVIEKELQIDFNRKDLQYLSDFYFDARYPGTDYVRLTKEEAEEAIHILEDILNKVREVFPGSFQ